MIVLDIMQGNQLIARGEAMWLAQNGVAALVVVLPHYNQRRAPGSKVKLVSADLVRWYGARRIEQHIAELADTARQCDPGMLVTYASYPPTEFLDLSFLDVIGFNVYLEREPEFRNYLARLQTLAGDRPLFLAELGLDEVGDD